MMLQLYEEEWKRTVYLPFIVHLYANNFICKFQFFQRANINNILDSFFDSQISAVLMDWKLISSNNILTIEFVLRHLDKDWDWNVLSHHWNISMVYSVMHPYLPWNWGLIAQVIAIYTISQIVNGID